MGFVVYSLQNGGYANYNTKVVGYRELWYVHKLEARKLWPKLFAPINFRKQQTREVHANE